MSKSISNIDWMNKLENVIREFVKEKLERKKSRLFSKWKRERRIGETAITLEN